MKSFFRRVILRQADASISQPNALVDLDDRALEQVSGGRGPQLPPPPPPQMKPPLPRPVPQPLPKPAPQPQPLPQQPFR